MSVAPELKDAWLNPSSIFRSAPFWSWNEALDPDRLCRQIESMHQAGMGGFFMHSRYGLKTPYLSDKWFECVSACVEKARQLDMKAYIYDEDRWPSGTAGGIVTHAHPEHGMVYLIAVSPQETDAEAQTVAAFGLQRDEAGQLISYQAIEEGHPPAPPGEAIVFQVRPLSATGAFNTAPYLDTMSPEAVAEFLHINFQPYADRYGKDFGQTVPAIFTDEPNYSFMRCVRPGDSPELPWTAELPKEFKRRRGYDLRERLPELLYPRAEEDFSKVRQDYYRTIAELFVEAYTAQIAKWCGKHHIAMTGHMLLEGKLEDQIMAVGSCMPHYMHMQWPGIDILRDQANELITAKQCSSVADQQGKERVLSELYGCTGWDWPLEGHKFIGEWQFAVGVNFRCPHLTHYSLAGGAKRDYPASIMDHSPWWKYYHVVEAHFARLSLMLTQGSPVRDVLVIHPIESGWGVFLPETREPIRALDKELKELVYTLSGQHYDWDFADEAHLATHAKVAKEALKVGRMKYRLVVVPPSITLRRTTIKVLEKFLAAGGQVLFVGRRPDRCDGEPSGDLAELIAQANTAASIKAMTPALEKLLPRRVSVRENDQEQTCTWAMLRSIKGGQILFIHSHDRQEAHQVKVEVAARGPVIRWDTLTGQWQRVEAESDNGLVRFRLDLPSTGSALLSLGIPINEAVNPRPEPAVQSSRTFDGPFRIELQEPNSLPLDYCRYRIGDGEFSEPMPTLKADEMIRKHFGLESRSNDGPQPWYLYAKGLVDMNPRGPIALQWTFHLTDAPAACKLAVEHPELYHFEVNGRDIGKPEGFWVDEDFKTFDITTALKDGQNEVLLTCDYRADMELEDLYLVGDFGVATLDGKDPAPGNLTLTAPPKLLSLGTWVGQGLDTYGGAVRYPLDIDHPGRDRRVRIRLPEFNGTAAAIHVNDKTFVLPWAPFEADITDALCDGTNTVFVEIVGSRKNTLGPLHTPKRSWVGPGEFSPRDRQWRKEYYLTPHGLTGPVIVETLK